MAGLGGGVGASLLAGGCIAGRVWRSLVGLGGRYEVRQRGVCVDTGGLGGWGGGGGYKWMGSAGW